MQLFKKLSQPPWRTVVPGCSFLLALWLGFLLWQPGLDIRDGRHDRRHNGIWLSHGWLGGDLWFIQNGITNELNDYRDPRRIHELADTLRSNHITDVFPHLCPAQPDGRLPAIDAKQMERFLDAFEGFRVIPWIGGPNSTSARIQIPKWRADFTTNVQKLLSEHPRLAGIQINVEPLTNGDMNFLKLLEELRAGLPPGKLLSVAAYPPPTRLHPYEDVHWNKAYYEKVAQRSDQLAVMMYDTGQHMPKVYQYIMANWTRDILSWSKGKSVLLGVPTYDDAGVDYHDPMVENLTNALLGIHRGLSQSGLPTNYQGVALYCEWETKKTDWQYFREHFLNQDAPIK